MHSTKGVHSDKYVERNDAGQCAQSTGMWLADVSPAFKYKYDIVSKLMGLSQGYRVLDWGAGCGHNLDVVARKYGFEGIAFDLVASNARWGRQHLQHLHAFCAADGAKLAFPANSFDAILSNAALYHAGGAEGAVAQCSVIKDQILRVLRPGGCAWFGWLGTDGSKVRRQFWSSSTNCLSGTDHVVFTADELGLFGVTEYSDAAAYSLFVCKAGRASPGSFMQRSRAGRAFKGHP